MPRRRAVASMLFAGVGGALLANASAGSPALRQRLIGEWRSDRDKTLKHWAFLPTATPEAKTRIESWFGQFTYSFTSRLARAAFPGGSWEARYRVESESENTLNIVLLHVANPESLTLYFDEPYFFVRSGRSNFEYFRRVAA